MTKVQLNEAGFIEDYYFDPSTSTSWDVDGPASATDGHLAVFDGATGKKIKDGGRPAEGDVDGPDVAVDGNLVVFDGTTGKKVKDSGSNTSSILIKKSIEISSNEIKNMFSTPIVLLSSPWAWKYLNLERLDMYYQYNWIPYSDTAVWFYLENWTQMFWAFTIWFISSKLEKHGHSYHMWSAIQLTENNAFLFKAQSENPTLWNWIFKIDLYYQILEP